MGRWCMEVEEVARISTRPANHLTRTESGFATWIMRFSARKAIATSPCCVAELRARSVEPMECLYRPIEDSRLCLLWLVAFCQPMRPFSAIIRMCRSRWLCRSVRSVLSTADAALEFAAREGHDFALIGR
jgi:uncharacterized membrane protein